jgi:hypothetical protein
VNIDNQRAAHLQAILRRYERVKTLHPAEAKDERESLKKALIAAQAQHDASTDDEERLDVSKRILVLAQRFKLVGGNLNDIPGHEEHRWVQPWKGSRQ